MIKPQLALVLLLASHGLAKADEVKSVEQRLAECRQEAEAEKRLSCYDSLPNVQKALAADVAANEPSNESQAAREDVLRDRDGRLLAAYTWLVNRTTDSITDRPRIALINRGEMESGQMSRPGSPTLYLRCFQARLKVFVYSNAYIGTNSAFTTRLRFGSGDAMTQGWNSSTSGTMAFSPNPGAFMANLMKVEHMLLEVTSFAGERYRMLFSTKGIDVAASEIASCWRPSQAQPARPPQSPRPRT